MTLTCLENLQVYLSPPQPSRLAPPPPAHSACPDMYVQNTGTYRQYRQCWMYGQRRQEGRQWAESTHHCEKRKHKAGGQRRPGPENTGQSQWLRWGQEQVPEHNLRKGQSIVNKTYTSTNKSGKVRINIHWGWSSMRTLRTGTVSECLTCSLLT